jgi:glycosyltransferase involved in cell wall biosynthesis
VGSFPPGKTLNIGLIIYGSLEIVTGGFLYDSKLVHYLRSMGDSVGVFSLPWRNYPSHLLDNFSSKLFRSLPTSNLDILLEDELNHPSLFLVNSRIREKVSCPIVSIVHHLRSSELRPKWQNGLYGLVEKKYLSTVDGFVFNSLTTQLSVESLVGDDKPSVVAYPGRDNVTPEMTQAQLEERCASSRPLKILFVGSLIPRKELHTLISALSRLPREAWRLEVVGNLENDPAYSNSIKRQINENDFHHNVKLLGTLKGSGLANAYASNHMLAVPSSYEGFGIVYLEAMGFGLPALGSNAGAAHELITHGLDGFLVRPGDVGAIAEYVRELMLDRDKLYGMSLAAMKRYWSHPTWVESSHKIREYLVTMRCS